MWRYKSCSQISKKLLDICLEGLFPDCDFIAWYEHLKNKYIMISKKTQTFYTFENLVDILWHFSNAQTSRRIQNLVNFHSRRDTYILRNLSRPTLEIERGDVNWYPAVATFSYCMHALLLLVTRGGGQLLPRSTGRNGGCHCCWNSEKLAFPESPGNLSILLPAASTTERYMQHG